MKLPIIDEQGVVIGSEERSVVHKKGLLHPEVYVLIRLPNKKFVFQRRSLSKDTNPGLMTFSVSGHIDMGQTFEEASVRELEEETGIKESIKNLIYLGNCLNWTQDPVTETIDNTLRYFFGYNFKGTLNDLKVEQEDGAGFEEYTIEEIRSLNSEQRKRFVESLFAEDIQAMFDKF